MEPKEIKNTLQKAIYLIMAIAVTVPVIICSMIFGIGKEYLLCIIAIGIGIIFEILIYFYLGQIERIVIDSAEIIVFLGKKEKNRISWKDVKKIYMHPISTAFCYIYLTDCQSKITNERYGNNHFIKFKCETNKAGCLSDFTNIQTEIMP
ncbi:MAG: hypothetical protein K2L12_04750 [Clostridia bacterium]|nr:hypothetical protein [Clostridia bacterium]